MDFAFTNDDAGGELNEERAVACFQRIIDFLDRQEVKGTFFWIPRSRGAGWAPGCERERWMAALRDAVSRGHDVQLHLSLGYLLGYPMRDPEERRRFGAWSLRERLEDAIRLYETGFGAKPWMLRPHGDFRFYKFPRDFERDVARIFAPLVQAGLRHISLPLGMSLAAFGAGKPSEELTIPLRHESGVVNYPWVVEDCTPRRSKRLDGSLAEGETEWTFDQWLQTARDAVDRHRTRNAGIGLINSHWHVMCRDWGQTQRFYELLFDHIRKNGCRLSPLRVSGAS